MTLLDSAITKIRVSFTYLAGISIRKGSSHAFKFTQSFICRP